MFTISLICIVVPAPGTSGSVDIQVVKFTLCDSVENSPSNHIAIIISSSLKCSIIYKSTQRNAF